MDFGMGFGFGGFETMFFSMFFIIFALIIGIFIVMAVKGIGTWNQNNQSPSLTVDAVIVSKRMDVRHHRQANHSGSSTSYYVTFQVESKDRMEFSVTGTEYGMLAEGDQGKLSFQGSRYLSFSRG